MGAGELDQLVLDQGLCGKCSQSDGKQHEQQVALGHDVVAEHAVSLVHLERKLSDFFAEKWKWNENMKMEMEFCGTEMETGILWRKWKRKWDSVFRWNRCGNGNFRFRLI
jgi:hypothetical protein